MNESKFTTTYYNFAKGNADHIISGSNTGEHTDEQIIESIHAYVDSLCPIKDRQDENGVDTLKIRKGVFMPDWCIYANASNNEVFVMTLTQKHLAMAIEFATMKHSGQFDKGGNPYILHPLQLMHWARRANEPIDVQIVCILHDVVEDCYDDHSKGFDEIAELFGDDIAQLVDNLTKRDGEAYDSYLARVNNSIRSVKVKRYDLRHNSDLRRLKGVTPKDTERAVKYMTAYYNFGEQWGLK